MDSAAVINQERIPRLFLPGIDLKDTLSFRNSLSSGVNKLPIPRLYHEVFKKCTIDEQMIQNYTQTTGTPVLAESIKLYEKSQIMLDNPEGKNRDSAFEHICVTSGATAAIAFFFDILLLNSRNAKC